MLVAHRGPATGGAELSLKITLFDFEPFLVPLRRSIPAEYLRDQLPKTRVQLTIPKEGVGVRKLAQTALQVPALVQDHWKFRSHPEFLTKQFSAENFRHLFRNLKVVLIQKHDDERTKKRDVIFAANEKDIFLLEVFQVVIKQSPRFFTVAGDLLTADMVGGGLGNATEGGHLGNATVRKNAFDMGFRLHSLAVVEHKDITGGVWHVGREEEKPQDHKFLLVTAVCREDMDLIVQPGQSAGKRASASGCHLVVIESSGCHQDVIRLPSGCHWVVIRMP